MDIKKFSITDARFRNLRVYKEKSLTIIEGYEKVHVYDDGSIHGYCLDWM
jgi:hypothetical protein